MGIPVLLSRYNFGPHFGVTQGPCGNWFVVYPLIFAQEAMDNGQAYATKEEAIAAIEYQLSLEELRK